MQDASSTRRLAFDVLAGFLAYPDFDTRDRLDAAIEDAELGDAEWRALEDFLESITGLPLDEWQALYTRSFDLNPDCSLEVGWHLYGESYRRGTFMVTMRGLLRRFDLEEGTDLPDHLAQVLRVLGRLPCEEAAARAEHQALPAVLRMREALAKAANPYEKVLEAVELAVTRVRQHSAAFRTPHSAFRVDGPPHAPGLTPFEDA